MSKPLSNKTPITTIQNGVSWFCIYPQGNDDAQCISGSSMSEVQGKMLLWLHEQGIMKETVEWLQVERTKRLKG